MNRHLLYFAVSTFVGAVLLLPLVGAGVSYFLLRAEFTADPLAETLTAYFLVAMVGMVMALAALPLTVPLGLAGWFISHRWLPAGIALKWRIRIGAAASGLAASTGFMLGFAWLSNDDKWMSIALVVGIAVLVSALISAEIVYRPARREMAR